MDVVAAVDAVVVDVVVVAVAAAVVVAAVDVRVVNRQVFPYRSVPVGVPALSRTKVTIL